MESNVKIDIVTQDADNKTIILYLVEEGPWADKDLEPRLRTIQERLFDVVDISISDLLVERFPEARGKLVRIHVDCYNEPPEEVINLITQFRRHIDENEEYQDGISECENIAGLEITYKCHS